jgi:hypothetical protein
LPLGLTVLAITGQTGQVADDGVASPGQAVEQGGLADVRSAHQGDYGNHAALHFVISENTKAAARQRLVLGTIPGHVPVGASPAREKRMDTAFIQEATAFVGAHREQARSYS